MVSLLLTLNALICVALIILILLQRSETGAGGMFGGAGSGNQNVVRNPLAKPTAVLAALFLIFSVVTAVLNKGGAHHSDSVMADSMDHAPVLPDAAIPAVPNNSELDKLLPSTPASPTTLVTPTKPTE